MTARPKPAGERAGIGKALAAAALFGLSTPLAKTLIADIAPQVLAGLLYLGSGVGLTLFWLFRRARRVPAGTRHLRGPTYPGLPGPLSPAGSSRRSS
jgi:drug/metabolite transporter (DMT)-like permease